MSYATPETFKPGERWIVISNEFGRDLYEVKCLEWSPSGKYCKFEYANSGARHWTDIQLYLVERLPDESDDDKTADTARAVEGDSSGLFCIRCRKPTASARTCPKCEQDIREIVIRESAQATIEAEALAESTQVEIVRTICRCEKCEKFRNAPQSDDNRND